MHNRSKFHKNGYDQYGALFGTLLKNDMEEEIYFQGLRERNLEIQNSSEVCQNTKIIGSSDHGFHFTLVQQTSNDNSELR